MAGYTPLAPIPALHLAGAIEILKHKDFVAFGSEAFETFRATEPGAMVLIYVSHDHADLVASHRAVYRGHVENRMEMRRMDKEGYRPASTAGEEWALYWKVSDIEKLVSPIPLTELQLPTGDYFEKGYPRGPLHVVN